MGPQEVPLQVLDTIDVDRRTQAFVYVIEPAMAQVPRRAACQRPEGSPPCSAASAHGPRPTALRLFPPLAGC